jgi:hypothetical protein
MALREFLSKNPKVVATAMILLLAACLGLIFSELKGGGKPPLPSMPDQAFYTTDDGVTLFADSLSKIPPIDHNGRPAVRAHVYSCDGGRHRWVQYLEKMSDKEKTIADSPEKARGHAFSPLIKKPGDQKWVPQSDPAALAILVPKCPDGMGSGEPQPVAPD